MRSCCGEVVQYQIEIMGRGAMNGDEVESVQVRVSRETHRRLGILRALLDGTFEDALRYLLDLKTPELDYVRKTIQEMDGMRQKEPN